MSMQPKLHALRTISLLLFFSCTTIFAQGQEPSVYTDRKDYSPGDTIFIQGDGWQAGERIELNIEHSKVSYGYYTFYATADSDGHFHNEEMVMQPFHKAESFILTAIGIGSGAAAQARFTDGTFNSRINGEWNSEDTWTVARSGLIRTSRASFIVEGSGTNFLSELSIGNVLTTANDSIILGRIKTIESETRLTLDAYASESHEGSGINYAARKVPKSTDNVVIRGHVIDVNQDAGCFNLELTNSSKLNVGIGMTLNIAGTLVLQNLGDAHSSASLNGLGTINTQGIIIGNNTNIIKAVRYKHTLTSSISNMNVAGDVKVNSYVGTNTYQVSDGVFYLAEGILTIVGSIRANNENRVNTSMFSLEALSGAGTLILRGATPFIKSIDGLSSFLLNGVASTVAYTANGDQVVGTATYHDIILGGSGVKSIGSIEIAGKLSMQGSATVSTGMYPLTYRSSAELEYKGSVTQSTGAEFSNSVPKLIINNALGVTLNNTKTVSTRITLIEGVLYTGPFNITLSTGGIIDNPSEKSYINGKLQIEYNKIGTMSFPIGKGGVYRPVRLELTSLSGPGSIMVEQIEEPLTGTLPANITLFSKRYWKITKAGTASLTYNLTLDGTDMPQNDYSAVLLRSNLIVVYDAVVNGNQYTVKGLSSFGDFGLGYKRLSAATTVSVADAVTVYGNASVDFLATVRGEDGTMPEGGTVTFFLRNYPVEGANTMLGIAPVGSGGMAALTYNSASLYASSYLIVAHYSGYGLYEASSSNQSIPASNGELLVRARPITVTADAKSKLYGENDPELTYHITNGSLVGDDNFTGKLVREAGEQASTYAIHLGSLSLNSNYALSFNEAELVIEKRPITVKAEAKRKVYGYGDPSLTYDVTDGNLVGEDVFQGTLSRSEGENVGSYLIDQGTFTAGENYELTFIKSFLTIAPAPATIHITDVNRTYNGTAQGVTVGTSPDGLAVAVTYNGEVTIPVNTGSYEVEAVLTNSNYKLVDEQGANLLKQTGTLVISPRALTIAVNNKSKVYGTDNPVLDGNESGLVSSDGISVTYETTAQTNSDVGEYPINASLIDPNNKLGNYSVTKTEGKLTIAPAPATIALSNLNFTYDGTPRFATAIADPAAAGTSVKYFQGGIEVASPTNAGSYVVAAELTNSNYAAEPVSSTLVINKAPTKTTVSVSGSIYDGKPHGGTASVKGDGGLSRTLTVTYIGATKAGVPYESNAAPTEAGDYTAAATYAESDNYSMSSDSQPFTIAQASATINVIDLAKVYNGMAQGATVLTGPENVAVSVTYNGSPSVPTDAGSYAVVAVLNNSNYTAADGTGTLVIAPKSLTVTAADKTKVYGDPLPTLTGTLSGDVAGDGITVSYSTIATQASDVVTGGYPISATLMDPKSRLVNYSVTNTTGVLTITPAPATIWVNGLSKTYNGQPQGATVITLPTDLAVNVTYAGSANVPTNAGSYAVVASLNNPNYSATIGTGTLVIDKADQEIVWETPDPITYGTPLSNLQLNARVMGVEGGSVPGTLNYTPDAGILLNAGSQILNVTAAATDNYKAVTETVTLIVNKSNQVIDFAPLNGKTYGDPPFDVSATTSSGRPVSFSIVSGPATLKGNTITITGAGDVVIRASQPGDGNFNPAADVDQRFTVQKAAAIITLDNLTHTYDGSVKEVAVSLFPGELSGVTITYQQGDVPVAAPINAGHYQVTATLSHMNYQATPATDTLVIDKAATASIVTVNDAVYDGKPHGGMAVVKGAGDLNQMLTITYRGTTKAGALYSSNEAPTEAGDYTAVATFAENLNYFSSSGSKSFVIRKAISTLTVRDVNVVFDGNSHSATATVSGVNGIISNASITYTYVGTPNGTAINSYYSSTPPVAAGVYTLLASFAGNSNHEGCDASASIIIEKATPRIVWELALPVNILEGTDLTGKLSATAFSREGELSGDFVYSIGACVVTPDTKLLANKLPYTIYANFSPTDKNNYNEVNTSKDIRVYAVPTITLSTPNPVQINMPSKIFATLGADVFNEAWVYSITIPGNAVKNGMEVTINSPAPIVYAVHMTYEDGLGKGYKTPTVYAVFYDPYAGFVTGGGWINSPAGAYTPNATLTGKANFGFVSKFEKGKTIPTGNTEFQFQAGGMNFRSSEYEYLVVAGARAQFKGKGTINGIGNYGFMLSAVDENLLGSGSPDKFRIKIWDNNDGGKVVYDNQMNATDDVIPTTEIGGGSIVIHTPASSGKKTNAIAADAYEQELTGGTKFILKAFPNPSVSSFNVQVESDNTEDKITLRIVDLNGRTIEVVNNVSQGQNYNIGADYRPGIYLVEMIQGSRRSQAMLLKVAE